MTLPVIGAALDLESLRQHRNWILDKHRDLELQSFVKADVLMGDWAPLVQSHKELLDGYQGRLGIHGPFWGFGIASPDPEIRAVVTRRMMQGLDVCAALEATQMVTHSPYTTWDYNNIDLFASSRNAVIELTHDTLGPVVKRAEDQGVVLVLENIEDKDPNDRLLLANSFDSPSFALSVDTGHAHYAHGSTGAPPVDYYIRSAGNRLGHVHLQDADGYADRHWALGEGTIRWQAVFSAIAQLTSRPRLILELRDKDGIGPSMEFLTQAGLGQ